MEELRRKAMMPKSRIKKLLEKIPESLDEFYDRILGEIDPDFVQQAIIAFQWLAFSARPLKLPELAEVLSIHAEDECLVDPDDKPADNWGVFEILPRSMVTAVEGKGPNRSLDERITEVFSSDEARERWNGKNLGVQLSHFSVKEYFLRNRAMDEPLSKFQFDEKRAHNVIAAGCFAYLFYIAQNLNLDTIDNFPQRPYYKQYEEDRNKWEKCVANDYPLLAFSAKCWPLHVEILEANANERLESLLFRFMKRGEPAFPLWRALVCHRRGLPEIGLHKETPIHLSENSALTLWSDHCLSYMIWLGLDHVVKLLLQRQPPPHEPSLEHFQFRMSDKLFDKSQLLLAQASGINHPWLIEFLLDHGVNVNSVILVGRNYPPSYPKEATALVLAAESGSFEAAKLLFNRGANVNDTISNYGDPVTALKMALLNGYPRLARFLIENGAHVNFPKGKNQVLLYAVRVGHSATKLVLEMGASEDSQRLAARYFSARSRDKSGIPGRSEYFSEKLKMLDACIGEVFGEDARSKIMRECISDE
ncbi:uncharacterized protein K452DRAFT_271183 [Aplosporella prunicola CBS 121167]|uniref:Uncharacterized protein n=1 Tax=Aplosporella prunicola CBS 121167 TaxID=1176127 RepID=A0A6A6BBT5_9PEZI|nr:uncharacterized protein K452DRAFT_271183 [Aplosporella prunicola CBS 121167]KAF2141580.1 hypothetical protein K452DRAFT_271183 [Aplosporella prunicola CBS 121167]